MDRDEAHKTLDDLAAGLHKQFPADEQTSRLDQLDSHVATLRMVVDHLYDEADRLTPRQ